MRLLAAIRDFLAPAVLMRRTSQLWASVLALIKAFHPIDTHTHNRHALLSGRVVSAFARSLVVVVVMTSSTGTSLQHVPPSLLHLLIPPPPSQLGSTTHNPSTNSGQSPEPARFSTRPSPVWAQQRTGCVVALLEACPAAAAASATYALVISSTRRADQQAGNAG